MMQGSERALLEARIQDILRQAQRRYEPVAGDFLSPGEAAVARFAAASFRGESIPVFFGGYADCERVRFLALPSYMESEEELSGNGLAQAFPEVAREAVAAVQVVGSGFGSFTHRDCMGAALGLGLRREVLGDIVMRGSREAVIFCTPEIAPYLCEALTKVGNDTVKTGPFTVPTDFRADRAFVTLRDTVASARLDCIVAALAGVAREKAQNMIRGDLVSLDHLPCTRPDKTVTAGSVVTVRHVGKFVIRSTEETTKKGRYRLVADKYI